MKVLAAMSGGVDSSVAAARLVDAGYDVVGVHIATLDTINLAHSTDIEDSTPKRGCCSKIEAGDAKRVADILNIPFYIWDFTDRFISDVVNKFISSYSKGETPNPCIKCNEQIKFSALTEKALSLGFDAVTTGHYARLYNGSLYRAVDYNKDQSYVLGALTQKQLKHILFPIGNTLKPQIREEAAKRGLAVAKKPDSHGICFIPSGDTKKFLVSKIGKQQGYIINHTGKILAKHQGVHNFTIGQRKGLGVSNLNINCKPHYVTEINVDTDTVKIGSAKDLEVWKLYGDMPVFSNGFDFYNQVECQVQVRAHGGISDALASLHKGKLQVLLKNPILGVAPGQTMVLYQPDRLIGDKVIAGSVISDTK